MRSITAFMLVFVFLLAGCASGQKKHTAQSQTVVYKQPQRTYQQQMRIPSYDEEETWGGVGESYEQPQKKAPVEQAAKLGIKEIQQALKKAGFYKGVIDGKTGPKTKEAIIKFQKARGFKADGIVGKRTSAELRKYL